MSSKLYNSSLYINKNISSITNASIIEYDIGSAGFSILKENDKLTKYQLDALSSMKKEDRNVHVGYILRQNKELNKLLNEEFKRFRKMFFEANELEDENIVSIKKDAIFVCNKEIKETEFGRFIKFNKKGVYTSYYNFNKIELYYNFDNNNLDIKGLGKLKGLKTHPFIHKIIEILRTNYVDNKTATKMLLDFANKYRKKKLDREYYRELNDHGLFRLKNFTLANQEILSEMIELEDIDITWNYMKFIVPLIKIIF